MKFGIKDQGLGELNFEEEIIVEYKKCAPVRSKVQLGFTDCAVFDV